MNVFIRKRRLGPMRVHGCECTEMFTCGRCLDAAVARTLAEHFAGITYHAETFDIHASWSYPR